VALLHAECLARSHRRQLNDLIFKQSFYNDNLPLSTYLSSASQPFYYKYTDPLSNLALRVYKKRTALGISFIAAALTKNPS